MVSGILGVLLFAAGLFGQAQPQKRDLRVTPVEGAREPGGQSRVLVPKGYALVVGIGAYQKLDPAANLHFSESDAEAIYNILISQEGGNFPPQNVRKLIGPQATLAAVHRELEEWLPTVAKEEDRVLVYFAGHGFIHGGQGYLAPYDVDLSRLETTAYPMAKLGRVIGSSIKARWKVLLTDACHSGAITPETTNDKVNETLGNLESSLFSLTASRQRESSFEDSTLGGGFGLFTYYVVQALRGHADTSGDGVVTADELAEYVRTNVREHAQRRGQQQTPSDKGDFDPNMILAFNPDRAASLQAAVLREGGLVVECNMDGVEVLVDGKPVGLVNKAAPLSLPGLSAGVHKIQGSKMGYEPDGPRDVVIYPGRQTTVSLRIQFAKVRKKAAVELFRRALEQYNRGAPQDVRRAVEMLMEAVGIDPSYSEAFLYLGRSHQVLFETDSALKHLRRALELDPDYSEARVALGAALLDTGDTDEAIRHLSQVVAREPRNALAVSHLAQAYRIAGDYDRGAETGRQAAQLQPSDAQAHLWLADCLRMKGQYEQARGEYAEYLRLSAFDTTLAQKFDYYFVGFMIGGGKKRRATQRDVYRDQRNMGSFGMCVCEQQLGNLTKALEYCQQALRYDPQDPFSYFHIAGIYRDRFNVSPNRNDLLRARRYYADMLKINTDLRESDLARRYIAQIDQVMKQLP